MASSLGGSFHSKSSFQPLPIPPLATPVPAADIPIPSLGSSESDKENSSQGSFQSAQHAVNKLVEIMEADPEIDDEEARILSDAMDAKVRSCLFQLSQTCKLISQISQVYLEICSIKLNQSTSTIRSPPSTYHKHKGPQPNTCEKDGKSYTHSGDSMLYDRYVDLHNSLNNPAHHAETSPHTLPPPTLPSAISSHASSEVSSSSVSMPCDKPPCDLMDSTFASTMELSSSRKETKEPFEEQDSRGGGLPCLDKTSEWRSLNRVGIGDCLKSPKMGHWQEDCQEHGIFRTFSFLFS